MKWISVLDVLPQTKHLCLIYDSYEIRVAVYNKTEGYWRKPHHGSPVYNQHHIEKWIYLAHVPPPDNGKIFHYHSGGECEIYDEPFIKQNPHIPIRNFKKDLEQ